MFEFKAAAMELKAFDMAPMKTTQTPTGASTRAGRRWRRSGGGSTVAERWRGGALAATGSQLGASSFAGSGAAGAASGRGIAAPASSTLSLVKGAFGIEEESKSKEIDHIAAADSRPQPGGEGEREARTRALLAGTAAPGMLEGLIEAEARIVAEAASLKTGEDAVAFFLRHGPSCPVKFVYGVRKYQPSESDTFKPYELRIVPFKEAEAMRGALR
jgi:hypothetical protein